MTINRRKFIKFASTGTAIATGIGYSLNRGIRYPRISLEPPPLLQRYEHNGISYNLNDLIPLPQHNTFRAYAPEPTLRLEITSPTIFSISVNNICSQAVLSSSTKGLKETIKGITRHIEINSPDKHVELKWLLPEPDNYDFAVIGDTGGDRELEWCIKRAVQLNALFLLHLGDFNYQEGDYDNAIKLFHNAPIPCYISIGNHDFYDQQLLHTQFTQYLGPLNHQFNIGKIRYVNLDTAASFLPAWSGQRGRLCKQLVHERDQYSDTVLFTHRPINDPRNDSENNVDNADYSHDIGSDHEKNWFISMLKEAHINTTLCGHLHMFSDEVFEDIRVLILGQGMSVQNIAFNGNFAQMGIGRVSNNDTVNYSMHPLNMPLGFYCNTRNPKILDQVEALKEKSPENMPNKCNYQETK